MEKTELAIITGAGAGTQIARHLDAAAGFAEDSHTDSTKTAYRADFARYEAWCTAQGVAVVPDGPRQAREIAGMVAAYASSMATGADGGRVYRPATIGRALAAISEAYKAKGFAPPRLHPSVVRVMKGIRRNLGAAKKQAPAIFPEDLRAMVADLGDDLRDTRDRAMLLIGWAGAFRRSELVALDVEHLTFEPRGVVIYLPRSKTDQEAEGRYIGIAYGLHPETCPVRALQAWLDASGRNAGAVFLQVTPWGAATAVRASDKTVDRMVKRLAKAASLEHRGFSAHSLRAGLATTARRKGYGADDIKAQTGHRSDVVQQYFREEDVWQNNVTEGIGL